MSRALSCLLFAALACTPVAAQGGGFQSGDLYLYDPDVTGSSITDGAIVHIDLAAAQSAIAVDTFFTPHLQGAMAFDPYRQRLVFFGSALSPIDDARIWCADAAGNLTDTGVSDGLYASFAPTGDGRIYMRAHGPGSDTKPFVWLSAANELNTLMDETGTAPFLLEGSAGSDVTGMIWDPGTQALFVASDGGAQCPGGALNKANVHKLPISADGARVEGAIGCVQIEVSTSGETPAGWSHGPAGQLLLVIDTNTNDKEPRLRLVDPVTLATSVFAQPGPYIGAAATNAGTWSHALSKTVVLDTLSDRLRAFEAGQVGEGVLLPLDGPLTSSDLSGETASLIEIQPSSCDGAWLPFGQGLAGTNGIVPRLIGSGCPQPGSTVQLVIDHALGGAVGQLFIGLVPASLPIKGGTFLVGNVFIDAALLAGGAVGVPGDGSVTLPATLPSGAALQGVVIILQAGFQDLGATKKVSLTNGVQMEIG